LTPLRRFDREGLTVIAPGHIDEMLHRHVDIFHRPVVDFDELCDTATVTWLAARMLHRYAQADVGITQSVHAVRLNQALQAVEHEMQWVQVHGETADLDDLSTAVSNALFHARQAAALLP
jgi:hypothetical protein